MDLLLDQLMGLLDQETKLYQSMHTVIRKEKDAVIQSELNALNEAVKEKENLLLKLRILEEHRTQLAMRLAKILNYPPQDLTLNMVAQVVDEPYAGQLKKYSANLSELLATVKEANHRNKTLFEHSIELLRGSFNLLSELMVSNTIYYRTGNIQHQNPTGKLLHGEI